MFSPLPTTLIPSATSTLQTLEFLTNPPLAFFDSLCSSKIRPSVVAMSVHGTTLCRDFRSSSYVGERAKCRARKQLFEAWTSYGVHAEFCVARTITSARSPLREAENLRRVCHGRNIPRGWSSICCTRKRKRAGDLRNSAFGLKQNKPENTSCANWFKYIQKRGRRKAAPS